MFGTHLLAEGYDVTWRLGDMHRLAQLFLVSSALFSASGCGIEQDYVLREPLEVRVGKHRHDDTVVLPPGTRVKRTFLKSDVAWIEIYGTTSVTRLKEAGEHR